MPSVVEEAGELIGRPDVRLMSLMDHTPGQRQFRDEVKLRDYYRGKGGGMTDAELDVLFARRIDYQTRLCREQLSRPRRAGRAAQRFRWRATTTPRASTSTDAVRDRVAVAEFPTTMEAAAALHAGRHQGPDGRAERGARRLAFRQYRRRRTGPRRRARYPVVGLRAVEPVDGGAATAAAAANSTLPPRSAPSARRRRKPSALPTAARSPPASAPTSSACISPATCRPCAASGAEATASHDRALAGWCWWSARAAPARIHCLRARGRFAGMTRQFALPAAW